MRVLMVTSTLPLHPDDGLPRFVFDLSRALSRICTVTVLAPHHPGAARCQRVGRLEIRRFRYLLPEQGQRLAYGAGMAANVKSFWPVGLQVPPYVVSLAVAVRQALRSQSFDVVNTHWLIPQSLAVSAVLGRQSACAHVATIHGGDLFMLERLPAAAQLVRCLIRRTALCLPVGRHLASRLERLAGVAVPHAVEPMGVDTRHFARALPGKAGAMPFNGHFILFVGRLISIKGVSCLIDAMPRLLARDPALGLVLIGRGPLETSLRQRVRRLGIDRRVLFAGPLGHDALPAYLHACSALVVPSLVRDGGETEGMPAVVGEALAAGCRVVASRAGAIPDRIKDGVNGLLARPGDASDLARQLSRALSPQGQALATAARQSVQHLDWSAVAARYRDHFQWAADQTGRTP